MHNPEKKIFFEKIILVFIKLWNRIDKHRINKFLSFLKKLILYYYEFSLNEDNNYLKLLNKFLISEIIFHPMGKGIVLEIFYFQD